MMIGHSSTPGNGDEKQPANSSLSFLPENEGEVARRILLHRRLSELMGGILPPGLDLSQVRRVLDAACGVGAWAYDMAWQHPDIEVVGIDKSGYFIEQARRHIGGGVSNLNFFVQDIAHLEREMFAPGMFDLVHLRFSAGEVSVVAFPELIRSLVGLCRPGGLLIWTEAELPVTTSVAFQRFCAMVLDALRVVGRAFSPSNWLSITPRLRRWLRDAGCQVVQDRAYAIEVSSGTKGHEMFVRQAWVFGHQVRSFLLETGVTTEVEFEEVFAWMQREIQEPDFCGVCFLRTVVGKRL